MLATVTVSGNIDPAAIQIDTGSDGANLYPGGTNANCVMATAPSTGMVKQNWAASVSDWVKDCDANTDTPSLTDSVATGINTNGTAAFPQTGVAQSDGHVYGHWNGVRVVDGVGNTESDLFITGGKENDTSTWNVGTGSVGSPKYDVTQAYIANNSTDAFFGMERRGNNGTTAFDFEFNKLAPSGVNQNGVAVPNRSQGDVLVTFEMSGSGSSGSATPHIFRWNATTSHYDEQTNLDPSLVQTSINNVPVPSAPWGTVDSKGVWGTGTIDKFEFAEAKINLAYLEGGTFNPCAGLQRYTQVRTRASATDNSDLKDTTKIFAYQFFTPQEPSTTLAGTCTQSFTFNTSGTSASWTFTVGSTDFTNGVRLTAGSGTTLSGSGPTYTSTNTSGTVNVTMPAGTNTVTIQAAQTAQDSNGCSANGSGSITVYRQLSAQATLTPECNNKFLYSSTVAGGKSPYTYAWTFQKLTPGADPTLDASWTTVGSSTTASGEFDAGAAAGGGHGTYRGLLSVHDTADNGTGGSGKGQCTATGSDSTTVYDAVGAGVTVARDCDNTFSASISGSGGNGSYTYSWVLKKLTNASTTPPTYTTATSGTGNSPTFDIDDPTWAVGGDGTYKLFVTVTDGRGCTASTDSGDFVVHNKLSVSVTKAPSDSSRTKATMTGTVTEVSVTGNAAVGIDTSDATYKWQKNVSGTWTDVSGQTTTTFANYDFAADTATAQDITIGTDTYKANIFSADFRLVAMRSAPSGSGLTDCNQTGSVTVKKVVGIDP